MFHNNDFMVENISNIPNNEKRIRSLFSLFIDKTISLKTAYENRLNYAYNSTEDSFRKTLNHSVIVGMLQKNSLGYYLSDTSKMFYINDISLDSYISSLLINKKNVLTTCELIITLLSLFSGKLKVKTLYSIFALIYKKRKDISAQAAVGRNIRSYLSLLYMINAINKENDSIVLRKNDLQIFTNDYIMSIDRFFVNDLVNIRELSNYINIYFDKKVTEDILSCVSTYELESYIWTKSSLYKNLGEIENLLGEYIMTVIFKREG